MACLSCLSGLQLYSSLPYIQLLIASRSLEEQTFSQPSTLSLPLQLASAKLPGPGRPVPRLCLQDSLLGFIHKQALQPNHGPAPGRSGLILIKPICKYHLQAYSQQRPPVYCILASGFLRSLDLGNQAAASRRRVPPRLKISVITGVPTPPASSSGADSET